MDYLRWMLSTLGCALLVSCGGGGRGGTPSNLSAPPITFAPGTFFRDARTVIMGQTVTASTPLDSETSATWTLMQPGASDWQSLGGSEPATTNFLIAANGEYDVRLTTTRGSVSSPPSLAALKAIPPQMEFVIDVRHANGATTIRVRAGDANVPMAGCIVYTGSGCETPLSVEAYLDGAPISLLQQPNATAPFGTGTQPAYEFAVDTAQLGTQPHGVRIVVSAPIPPGSDPYSFPPVREAFVAFDTSGPANAGFFDVLTNPVRAHVGASGPLIFGDTAQVLASPDHGVFRIVQAPLGSTAAQTLSSRTTPPEIATFVPDRTGTYTFEYTPLFTDGSTATPVYSSAQVYPHSLWFDVWISNDPSTLDQPPQSADAVRVSVGPVSDSRSYASGGSVEAFLDGVSLGVLRASNTRHLLSQTRSGITYSGDFYSFDIAKSRLGSSAHSLKWVATDARGLRVEGSMTFVPGVDAAAVRFGPVEDSNP